MNLIFNDLSFLPLVNNDSTLIERFLQLMNVFKKANQQFGFKGIIFPTNIGEIKVTEEKTFYQWAYDIPHKGYKNKILSHIKRPFTNDVLEGQIDALSKYYFENAELGIPKTYCTGLATALVTERPSTGLTGLSIWENLRISFQEITNDDFDIQPVEVFNIANEQHLAEAKIIQFVESIQEIHLLESELSPDQKSIHFRPDHGSDILMAFARRMINSVYVNSVINSLPFNPRTTRFLRDISSDGKIEIVLYWEDAGYGMVIQTTGRNHRETEAIAEILRNEYDR